TLFTSLFGGGKARLELVESDDPLQAGLEIIASPPGKKPQVLSLLSGGEKALTALSLIFAVFLTNPAPICVLDEVDAPLDDANVERFCKLLDKMTQKTDTRFLVITHHPTTMSHMDQLFGVTMAEKGISQMVSVDLSTAERFREKTA
ncbi:MAG: chromosome segregation protein SMC, partial [Hyphomicrobiaceae bacterium]|nr:chromosome segregation protein SMC [Hyphomicrobiaceae bacterium]